MNKVFDVPATFVFSGVFKLKAKTLEQAEELARLHCGMVQCGGVHSSLPDEHVDWDFPVHPEKLIGNRSGAWPN